MQAARPTRRTALKTSVAFGGYLIAPEVSAAESTSANEQLNIACIGIGGRGAANVNGVKSQNLVALCDVDQQRAGKVFEQHNQAEKFADYRKMFDKLEKQIDAVVVSTPDHTHFHPSMAAMERGKHLYCEKPMAHSVGEVRQMTKMAVKQGVATQLGCQRHALANMHRSVELIQAGAIGDVSEVYSWVGGSRGMPSIPKTFPKVPETVDWDLWLGPAMPRPYDSTYCPYGWRFWWDFGTGETGNWGCHILDIPFWALGLKYPSRVEGSGPEVDDQRTPKQMATKMHFAEQGVDLHWDHASAGPAKLKELGIDGKGMNTLFIGTKGMLLTGFNKLRLLPEEKFADFKAPEPTIPKSPGFYKEWISACKGGEPATCDFRYSGPLAETVLLGNAAYRASGSFDWDGPSLTASGNDAVQPFLKSEYRKGWEVAEV
ncbi:Gfo/Idh/MocA family protein [Rosistilla oblonga]|uniref:Inositol 2-dehydrogenase n=1 Tax=Rosistilla oblonga TaxID=2527990 RepID=A0A518IZP8_9BACT|nr:Gfo/Idh/MocA family oxidoreductase [Rosistilla oblonga]QDV58562.1 Inositol 2-dehydrogenase [Rosistilla oblonga]